MATRKMSKADFKKKMKGAKDNLNKFSKIPYGTYVCMLTKAIHTNKDGKDMVQFVYKVLEGECRGREHRNFYHISNDTGFNILIQDLANVGYDIDQLGDFEDLFSLLAQIEKDQINVSIRVFENPDPNYANYPKTRIEEVIDDGREEEGTEEDPGEEEAGEDDTAGESQDVDPDEDEPAEEEASDDAAEEEEEEEEEEEAEEEADVKVGAKVSFLYKGKELEGVIKDFTDNDTKALIVAGGKKYKIKGENITGILG